MPKCKCCGERVVNGVVHHSECYEELSKRADELGEELTAAMELVRRRNAKIKELVAHVTDIDVGDKWEREMPTESGWYWVIVELVKGKREMFPAYFDAEHFYMQSIEDGIDCELLGVTHVMPMQFPEPPKEVE